MQKEVINGLIFVLLTVAFTVYGQLMLKWQILKAGSMPLLWSARFFYFINLFKNLWVLSAFFSAFLASLAWMSAMTKLPLSYAYPFMSLSFVAVLILSAVFFGEPLSLNKIIGFSLLISGLVFIGMS